MYRLAAEVLNDARIARVEMLGGATMKRQRWFKLSVGGALMSGVLATVAISERALANSSGFSWRMDKRYISGKANGRFHFLEAGTVTIQGHIEITERLRGSVSTPISVKISLIHADSSTDEASCSVTITPDTAVGARKPFSATCGPIKSGKYWFLIKKNTDLNPDGDGWHNGGNGTVSTQ